MIADPDRLTSDELREEIKRLEDYISLISKHEDLADPLLLVESIQDRRELQAHLARRNGHDPTISTEDLIQIMSTVEREDVDFLWANRIPRGKITDFSGDPGIGKSTVASAIAACISRGDALPFDKEPEAPLRSLIISCEDTAADVLRPRFERMEADMSLIAIPNVKLNLAPSQIDAEVIDQMLTAWPAALLIIDPIIAYTQGKNTSKPNEMREFLGPLGMLAEKHKTAAIIVRHFTKDTKAKALYRSQGSIDFVAISRSAFVFGEDPNNLQRRFMSHVKSSLGPLMPTLEFYIEEHGNFRWGLESTESADDILTPSNREPKKLNAATKFLEELLQDGAMPSNEVKHEAKKLNLSWTTIWKAKDTIGIKATKESGIWFWTLP